MATLPGRLFTTPAARSSQQSSAAGLRALGRAGAAEQELPGRVLSWWPGLGLGPPAAVACSSACMHALAPACCAACCKFEGNGLRVVMTRAGF